MDAAGILRIYRTITEMSLKEIEMESGLSKYTISGVESGNKPIKDKQIRILAQVYKANYEHIAVIAEKSEKEDWSYDTVLYYCLGSWLTQNGCCMGELERMSYEKSLAKVLKALRVVNNMSCVDVAQNLECTTTCVYDAEGGESFHSLKRVRALAELYKVRLSEVFRLQEECMQNRWNFQKVLFESVSVWRKENS